MQKLPFLLEVDARTGKCDGLSAVSKVGSMASCNFRSDDFDSGVWSRHSNSPCGALAVKLLAVRSEGSESHISGCTQFQTSSFLVIPTDCTT